MDTPCNWPIDPLCADCLDDLDAGVRALVEEWAVEWLWRATGQRFGLCPVTVRPCRAECRGHHPGPWGALRCGRCPGSCSCGSFDDVRLPDAVQSIDEVIVDGVTLTEDQYQLLNGVRLVRTDGEAWPRCQDFTAAEHEPGSWLVTYTPGLPIPAGAGVAAATLACELAKACTGADGCRLPKRIQTVTRQGVTVGFVDNFDQLSEGMTGIFEVDGWIATVNKPAVRSLVSSPDIPAGYRV